MSIKRPGVRLATLLVVLLAMVIPSGVALAQEAEGPMRTAVISDGASPGDTLTISIEAVSPQPGTTLEGWLITDDWEGMLSTGKMSIDGEGNVSHTYVSPTGDNLIAGFNKFVVTVEPVPDPSAEPSGEYAFGARVKQSAMDHIRYLLISWPPGSDSGVFGNLAAQLSVAMEHSRLASSASSLEDMHMHAQHLINVIEGEGGANFDSSAGNPGDGMGVMTHVSDLENATFASQEDRDNLVLARYAAVVMASAANIEARVTAARDAAVSSLGRSTVLDARLDLVPVAGLLSSALNGLDANSDGMIESGGTEGGASQAYVDAQRMATYDLAEGELMPLGPELGIGLSRTGGEAAGPATMIALAAAAIAAIGAGAVVLRRRRQQSDR